MSRPRKPVNEPNWIVRLLMSDVTNTWGRTWRSVVLLLGLTLMLSASTLVVLFVGSAIATPLLRFIAGS